MYVYTYMYIHIYSCLYRYIATACLGSCWMGPGILLHGTMTGKISQKPASYLNLLYSMTTKLMFENFDLCWRVQ